MSNFPAPAVGTDNQDKVIDYHVCRYLCDHADFDRADFLQWLLNEERMLAFGQDDIREGIRDRSREINQDILRSLDRLANLGLVTRVSNTADEFGRLRTHILELFCPTLMRYQMVIIRDLVDDVERAEDEILHLRDSNFIFTFLERLEQAGPGGIVIESLHDPTYVRLAQLSVIDVSVNRTATITQLGRILNERRRHQNNNVA